MEGGVNVEELEQEVKELEMQDTFNEDNLDVLVEDGEVENVVEGGEENVSNEN